MPITAQLRQIPYLGPIRLGAGRGTDPDSGTASFPAASDNWWAYSGLALETRIRAEYRLGRRSSAAFEETAFHSGPETKDHNHDLKGLFKVRPPWPVCVPDRSRDFYQAALAKGIKPTMARLTLARKIEQLR